jgi:hypothetical protein
MSPRSDRPGADVNQRPTVGREEEANEFPLSGPISVPVVKAFKPATASTLVMTSVVCAAVAL